MTLGTTVAAPRQPGQPLLSISIPTFNRAGYLAELLESILPQYAELEPGVLDLVISDNASTDATPQVVEDFVSKGLPIRYFRNGENIGSDANFVRCFGLAAGEYCWVLGDDDLLTRTTLRELTTLLSQQTYDLAYLSSFGFSTPEVSLQVRQGTLPAAVIDDRFGRLAEDLHDPEFFLHRVNALIGLISVVIVNKNRLLATPHPPLESLLKTNLVQLGWILPLMRPDCRVLYFWKRLLAYREFNSFGWGACEVFGVRLRQVAGRYLAGQPLLKRALLASALRCWLFDKIFDLRTGSENPDMLDENYDLILRPVFGKDPLYWLFIWPVARLPLPLARVWYRVLRTVNRGGRYLIALLHHLWFHGAYLRA